MPCDTIQRSQIEFLPASTDLGLLKKALLAMGYSVQETAQGLNFYRSGTTGTYEKATGKITTRGYAGIDVAEVKKGYSEQVVISQAAKHGWKIEWSTNKAGNKEAVVQKRS